MAWIGTALLLAVGGGGCDRPSSPPPSVQAAGTAPEAVVEVRTARVRRGAILQRISAPGSLVARRESRIGSEVRGRIERIFVAEGDRVAAGDPLFQIDPKTYEAVLRQAESGVDLAAAERRQAESDLRRAQALRSQDVVSEDDIARLETAVALTRARKRQAIEAVALARRNVEQTLVGAPFSGSIVARLVDEGTTALVQPQTIVVVIQETSDLEARAAIPESRLTAVSIGDPVLLHVEGLPAPIQSEISAVGDAIDPATRTYRVKMRVPNPEHRLKAGVFARVEILPEAKRDVVLVPRAAIRSEEGRSRVFTVRGGRAVAVPVQLGIVSEDAAEVLHGVRVDEEVIVGAAARNIAPGMRVEVLSDDDGVVESNADAAPPGGDRT
ncbi:MAG: efflux RND transporter periplasmic adaptor subunit [Myxococcales bacterium]|nr:efflux RND transporter periplasmic adaptor subunit [Myxococcales bacterium]